MNGPDPRNPHPMTGFPQVHPAYREEPEHRDRKHTYYDDPEDSENFERNVLYHYPFMGDRLVIGKFCALAKGGSS